MSGHSHWATTKRDKFAKDAKRSKVFSKVSRLIMIAARQGGGDPGSNPSLRLALDKARDANMPKDNIQKAINKGLGVSSSGQAYEEVIYEGYGPEGVAFMVKAVTDNRNRTVSDIRNIFSRSGGSLGSAGSTAYIFGSDPQNPSFKVDLDDSSLEKVTDLYDELDEYDDVSAVYMNANIELPEEE
jgi:YebC/PmpR family DNA-binding regulatory protein